MVRSRIRELERRIEKIKSLHILGQLSAKEARRAITAMEKELHVLLACLPEHERELYLIKKQYGI